MRKSQKLICLLALLAAAGCSGMNPATAWDPYFDFASLRTYDWAPKAPESGANLPYEAIERAVKRAVDARMRAAGFTESSSNPTFRLTYYVGLEEIEAIGDSPYYGPGWGAYWGWGWDGPAGVNQSLYDAGTVTVDVLSPDPSIGLVWRGRAQTELRPGISAGRAESTVESALGDILEDFPPLPER